MLVEEVNIFHTADINPRVHIEKCFGIRPACSHHHQTAYNKFFAAVVRSRHTPSLLKFIHVLVPPLKSLKELPAVVDGRTLSINISWLQKVYYRIKDTQLVQ